MPIHGVLSSPWAMSLVALTSALNGESNRIAIAFLLASFKNQETFNHPDSLRERGRRKKFIYSRPRTLNKRLALGLIQGLYFPRKASPTHVASGLSR